MMRLPSSANYRTGTVLIQPNMPRMSYLEMLVGAKREIEFTRIRDLRLGPQDALRQMLGGQSA